jgi:hypothetical protein
VDVFNQVLIATLSILVASAIGSLLFMWRDIAVLKRDVDGLAEVIGTKRSKARCKKSE